MRLYITWFLVFREVLITFVANNANYDWTSSCFLENDSAPLQLLRQHFVPRERQAKNDALSLLTFCVTFKRKNRKCFPRDRRPLLLARKEGCSSRKNQKRVCLRFGPVLQYAYFYNRFSSLNSKFAIVLEKGHEARGRQEQPTLPTKPRLVRVLAQARNRRQAHCQTNCHWTASDKTNIK